MTTTYIVLCRRETDHSPVIYDPAVHGTTMKTYPSLQEAQQACDQLNQERS